MGDSYIFAFIIGIGIAMTGGFFYVSRTKTFSQAAATERESRVMRRQALKTVAGVYVFFSCVILILAILFADAVGIVFAGITVAIAILLLLRLATLR